MMIKEPPQQYQPILQAAAHFSKAEILELISYLTQQAQDPEPIDETLTWLDMEGIAPNLLEGQDAQEWVSQSREAEQRDFR